MRKNKVKVLAAINDINIVPSFDNTGCVHRPYDQLVSNPGKEGFEAAYPHAQKKNPRSWVKSQGMLWKNKRTAENTKCLATNIIKGKSVNFTYLQ